MSCDTGPWQPDLDAALHCSSDEITAVKSWRKPIEVIC